MAAVGSSSAFSNFTSVSMAMPVARQRQLPAAAPGLIAVGGALTYRGMAAVLAWPGAAYRANSEQLQSGIIGKIHKITYF